MLMLLLVSCRYLLLYYLQNCVLDVYFLCFCGTQFYSLCRRYVHHTSTSSKAIGVYDIAITTWLQAAQGSVVPVDNVTPPKSRTFPSHRDSQSDTQAAVSYCIRVCTRLLKVKLEGEYPGVDPSFVSYSLSDSSEELFGLTAVQWDVVLATSYTLPEKYNDEIDFLISKYGNERFAFDRCDNHSENVAVSSVRSSIAPAQCIDDGLSSAAYAAHRNYWSARYIKVGLLLRGLSQCTGSQYAGSILSIRNIWAVKAPEACRGVGFKLMYKLGDMLECERGMGGRTVQKYVENPLLAPDRKNPSTSGGSTKDNMRSPLVNRAQGVTTVPPTVRNEQSSGLLKKFDLRIWVLVTSFEPLVAYIYTTVYGRICAVEYRTDVASLLQPIVHLTNYSVQRINTSFLNGASTAPISTAPLKRPGAAGATSRHPSGESSKRTVSQLRGMCNLFAADGGDQGASPNSFCAADFLVTHEQLLQIIQHHFPDQSAATLWSDLVWPRICTQIWQTLEVFRPKVVHRNRSFELLGYDILLDHTLTPWILEANMSPGIAHRNNDHNAVISSMATGLVQLVTEKYFKDVGASDKDAVGAGVEVGGWTKLDMSESKVSIEPQHCGLVLHTVKLYSIYVQHPHHYYHRRRTNGSCENVHLSIYSLLYPFVAPSNRTTPMVHIPMVPCNTLNMSGDDKHNKTKAAGVTSEPLVFGIGAVRLLWVYLHMKFGWLDPCMTSSIYFMCKGISLAGCFHAVNPCEEIESNRRALSGVSKQQSIHRRIRRKKSDLVADTGTASNSQALPLQSQAVVGVVGKHLSTQMMGAWDEVINTHATIRTLQR